MLLYFVSFLDRVNVGFAAFSMNQAIGLTSSAFGFGSGIFFLGYVMFQVPANLIMMRVGARVWIARVVIVWGLVSVASAFVVGPHSFYTLRFLLGLAESGFFPGTIFYLSLWFPARERAAGNCGVHGRRAALDGNRLADFRSADGVAEILGPDELAVALHY